MVLPEGGLGHRVFEGLGAESELRVSVCFDPLLDDDRVRRVGSIVYNWHQVVDARARGEGVVGGRPWVAKYAVSARMRRVPDPVDLASVLVEELSAMGLPIREVTFSPFRSDPDEPPHWQLIHPMIPAIPHPDDPRGELTFSDFPAYWEAVWDFASPPPRSENPFYLRAGRWDQQANTLRLDERLMTLHEPGIRICMGVTQSGSTDAKDERSDQVAAAIGDALARHFDRAKIWVFPGDREWAPPRAMRRDWSEGVESIEHEGRRGYSFAVDAPAILHDVAPDAFRYREVELMRATADVVRGLGLAPVILWQRFGEPLAGPAMAGAPHPFRPDHYVIQVWEA